MNQAGQLYYLQTLDLQILKRLKRLQEINAALKPSEQVAQARLEAETSQRELSQARIALQEAELELKSLSAKLAQSEKRLYNGHISNPKELKNLEDEVSSLKRRCSELETRVLETMTAVEESRIRAAASEARLSEVQTVWEQEQKQLESERTQLQTELQRLKAARVKHMSEIGVELLNQYETLKTRTGGRPVSELQGNICSICGVQLPTGIAQQVRQGQQIRHCHNCGRILYFKV